MPKPKPKKLDSWHDLVAMASDAESVTVSALVRQDPPVVKVAPGVKGWWLLYLPMLPQGWPITARLAKEIEKYLAPPSAAQARREAVGLAGGRIHQPNINFMAGAIASGKVVVLRAGIRSQSEAIDWALAQTPPALVAREGKGSKWAVYQVASILHKDTTHAS